MVITGLIVYKSDWTLFFLYRKKWKHKSFPPKNFEDFAAEIISPFNSELPNPALVHPKPLVRTLRPPNSCAACGVGFEVISHLHELFVMGIGIWPTKMASLERGKDSKFRDAVTLKVCDSQNTITAHMASLLAIVSLRPFLVYMHGQASRVCTDLLVGLNHSMIHKLKLLLLPLGCRSNLVYTLFNQ